MIKINDNYNRLQAGYLFSTIAKKINEFTAANPDKEIIKLGIGDTTRPLQPTVVEAIKQAADTMGTAEGFHGYGPEQGYAFLREAICKNDYEAYGTSIEVDEIFVSDGAKCDSGNIQEIFSDDMKIAVLDPVYPVYVDTNVMAGRSGEFNVDKSQYENIIYMPATAENGFKPELPTEVPDVIYLCYPNNPTGTTLTRDELKVWVDYAKANDALILFDAAYEAFVSEDDVPHTIYEIEGADEVAIEFKSFSKTAGFTGTRCAYTVVPKKLKGKDAAGNDMSLHFMWNRRHCTKFNGVPYITQMGALATYSKQGKKELQDNIDYYMANAKIIKESLEKLGIECYGGVNSPYVWLKTPAGLSSWEFFDKLLNEAGIVGTPGAGFGISGEGYFRLTAFNTKENTLKAVDRIAKMSL